MSLENKIKIGDQEFYLINFPVGDWSKEGHEKCDNYLVRSNKPVADVRQAHHRSLETLGFNIGSLCCQFEEIYTSKKILSKLKELNYDFDRLSEISDEPDCYSDAIDSLELNSECVLDIWLFLLNKIDPSLDLKALNVPSIAYNGFDNQMREFMAPGYGCFR